MNLSQLVNTSSISGYIQTDMITIGQWINIPAGTKRIEAMLVGGGGGGALKGGGGGFGGWGVFHIPLTGSSQLSVHIGGGGAGGISSLEFGIGMVGGSTMIGNTESSQSFLAMCGGGGGGGAYHPTSGTAGLPGKFSGSGGGGGSGSTILHHMGGDGGPPGANSPIWSAMDFDYNPWWTAKGAYLGGGAWDSSEMTFDHRRRHLGAAPCMPGGGGGGGSGILHPAPGGGAGSGTAVNGGVGGGGGMGGGTGGTLIGRQMWGTVGKVNGGARGGGGGVLGAGGNAAGANGGDGGLGGGGGGSGTDGATRGGNGGNGCAQLRFYY